MKKIIIVTPTYNEKENISPLLSRIGLLSSRIRQNFDLGILFIDDNSPDGTADEIERQKKKSHSYTIDLIKRDGKLGLGTAYIRGFAAALKLGADFVVQMDADLSHDPMAVANMTTKFDKADIVIGSRYIKGGKLPKWSLSRKLISGGGNLYTRLMLGFKIHDWTGGFNAYSKEVLQKIDLDNIKSNGYSFQIEMKYKSIKAGFRPVEVPIEFHDRKIGKSKFSKKIFIEALINTLKLRLGRL